MAIATGLNFSVNPGDYLCIVGENGAGKSTLIKTILQLLDPVSGSIRYGDGLKPFEIGYLPQQNDFQKDFPATVSEIVLSGFLAKPEGLLFGFFYSRQQKETARQYMEQMGVWEFRKKSYRKLSGGQKQRVLLARALCAADRILLLDEPASGLDPKVAADLYRLLEQLHRRGVTLIIVSHDIKSSVEYASHILHVGKKQLFFGETEDYLKSSAWELFSRQEED